MTALDDFARSRGLPTRRQIWTRRVALALVALAVLAALAFGLVHLLGSAP